MQKKYAPVKLRNPSTKNALVRLLQGQQLNIVFDNPSFLEYKIDIAGSFLQVEEISEVRSGWAALIAQKVNISQDNTLFLGEVNFYDANHNKSASLCVVTHAENNDILRIVNPSNCNVSLEPGQILEVNFWSKDFNNMWKAYPSPKDLELELLQPPQFRPRTYNSESLVEQIFRFRLNKQSIELLSSRSYGRYEAGHVLFSNGQQNCMLGVSCAWRPKSSIYKALLLPKTTTPAAVPVIKAFSRQTKICRQAQVELVAVDFPELEFGCNIMISR